ncbi:unnamed protein product, partial [Closterium sp. NIES-54]
HLPRIPPLIHIRLRQSQPEPRHQLVPLAVRLPRLLHHPLQHPHRHVLRT